MTNKREWTSEEVAILTAGILSGVTHRDIAATLQRTKPSVKNWAYKLGLYTDKPSKKIDSVGTDDEIAESSWKLACAIDRAFHRYANDNGVGYVEAMNLCLYAGEAR